jgi:hypothetical protein
VRPENGFKEAAEKLMFCIGAGFLVVPLGLKNRKSAYGLSKNIPTKEHQHRDLSTPLRSGRDDKVVAPKRSGETSSFLRFSCGL